MEASRAPVREGPCNAGSSYYCRENFVNDVGALIPPLHRPADSRRNIRAVAFLIVVAAFASGLVPEMAAQGVRKGTLPMVQHVAQPAAPVFTGPRVKLRISNFTGQGVELVWMSPSGKHENRGVLPPTELGGAPAMIDTFGGHLWLLKSAGRVLQFIAASNQPVQEVQVGPPAAVPGGAASKMREANGLVVPEQAPVASLVAPPVMSGPLPKELKKVPENAHEFLLVHNAERARLGIAPLRWSSKLAKYAQKWAKHLASSGDFEHRGRDEARYGENLYRGSDDRSPGDAARKWLEERVLYRGGPIAREELTLIGHYTQMIWQETTHVGFGVARGPKGIVVVANYSPGGNRSRQVPYSKPK